MVTTQNSTVYVVNSDLDDGILYAEFETKEAAIEYAKRNLDKLPFVDELEVSRDANGEIDSVFNHVTIWDHTMVDSTSTESEADYWDDLASMYGEREANKHDLGDTTWFESMNNLVETLEENEDEVECKECFDLFPKADCIKVDLGYICPTCAEAGTVSEEDLFKIDFPEYEKFSDGNAMVPDEPTVLVEPSEEVSQEDPEDEIISISTPEEAVPFLVSDEEEAIAGYEKAAEVVAESDLENKEEILDVIDHIKEEEEEHIEELTELVELKEDEVPEDETEPTSNEETELVEKIDIDTKDVVSSGNVEIWGIEPVADNKYNAILLKSYEDISYSSTAEQEVFDEMYKIDGLFTFGFTKSGAPELLAWNTAIWRTLSGCEIIFEDPAYDAALEKAFSKTESLNEHVNKEYPSIESDQELEGTDNAVVDCKAADIITHSEDEKPVDCKGEKKPLEKPLTESKRDPFHEAIFEAIDYLTEFSDIFPVPGNIGAANWEELKDDINYGLSSDFEIAEIIMEYLQKDLAIGEKHPEIFEDDPQSELTLETYNRLKRAYDKAVEEYKAANPEDFEEQLDLTHGHDHIKSVTSLVHTAVEKLTKDNRVGTRPDGVSFYVLSDKRSADPEKMKKVILDTLAENGYEPEEVQFVDKDQVYGYVIGKIKMMAKATKKESLTEEAEDADFNPTSEDPAEKPSENVKMANTASTTGMDFEAACQKFGIELNN